MNKIAIFPLNLVIFPGSKYPLHIFEERYKILINKCLNDNSGFGIVALLDKKISDVGVYVKVILVLKKYENGEMDIIVEGVDRFLINSTYLHSDGYYVSNVEKYLDNKDEIDSALIDELQNDFEEIVELANYKLEESFWKNLDNAKLKSFKFAEKSGMSYDQQQEFLILKSENERLYFLINYFNWIKEKVNNADLVKKIMMNDGYLN